MKIDKIDKKRLEMQIYAMSMIIGRSLEKCSTKEELAWASKLIKQAVKEEIQFKKEQH